MAYDYLEVIDRFNTGQKMANERWDINQIVLATPERLTATTRAADLLLGRDVYAGFYIANYRKMVKLGLIADAGTGKS